MTVSDLTGTTKGMDLPSYADEAANQSARRGFVSLSSRAPGALTTYVLPCGNVHSLFHG